MKTESNFPWPISSDPLNGMDIDAAYILWPQIPPKKQTELFDQLIADRLITTGAYIQFLTAVYAESGQDPVVAPEPVKVVVAEPVKKVTPDAVISPTPAKKGKGRLPLQLSLLAPLPTDFTRIGPFFPSEIKEFGEKTQKVFFAEKITLVKNSWGELTYTGPRLTVSHEDLFLVILAAITSPDKRKAATVDGFPTYKYCGSMRELLVAKGIKNPTKTDYDQAFTLLENMSSASISYRSSTNKCRAFEAMVSKGVMNEKGDLEIHINPFFAEILIQQGLTTWLDLEVRNKIKSAYGKSIYRFLSGQNEWSGNISVLAEVINCSDCRMPDFRRNIRNAMKEMISKNILSKGSGIIGNRIVLKRGTLMNKIRLPEPN